MRTVPISGAWDVVRVMCWRFGRLEDSILLGKLVVMVR